MRLTSLLPGGLRLSQLPALTLAGLLSVAAVSPLSARDRGQQDGQGQPASSQPSAPQPRSGSQPAPQHAPAPAYQPRTGGATSRPTAPEAQHFNRRENSAPQFQPHAAPSQPTTGFTPHRADPRRQDNPQNNNHPEATRRNDFHSDVRPNEPRHEAPRPDFHSPVVHPQPQHNEPRHDEVRHNDPRRDNHRPDFRGNDFRHDPHYFDNRPNYRVDNNGHRHEHRWQGGSWVEVDLGVVIGMGGPAVIVGTSVGSYGHPTRPGYRPYCPPMGYRGHRNWEPIIVGHPHHGRHCYNSVWLGLPYWDSTWGWENSSAYYYQRLDTQLAIPYADQALISETASTSFNLLSRLRAEAAANPEESPLDYNSVATLQSPTYTRDNLRLLRTTANAANHVRGADEQADSDIYNAYQSAQQYWKMAGCTALERMVARGIAATFTVASADTPLSEQLGNSASGVAVLENQVQPAPRADMPATNNLFGRGN